MYIDVATPSPSEPRTERRAVVKRGAVTMTFDPLEVRWNGARVPLTRVEGALLATLMRRSRLHWDAADGLLVAHDCCPDSRDVLIHRIRRKFEALGAGDPIETIRGWGLRFRTECDRLGSSAFWIGATEADLATH